VVTQGQLTDEWMQRFSDDAAALVARRKTQPPAISSILADVGKDRDFGYELGGDMDGLYGLWHRLWAAISMAKLWGSPEFEDLPVALRAQFESLLGRAMTDEEYARLTAHAHHHSETVMAQRFGVGAG
jgi:hypothetical protein